MKSISKGQKLSIEKELPSKAFIVGLKWNQDAAPNFEIDSSIMMLSNTGKLEKEENFVFYNNDTSSCGGVKIQSNPLSGYKRTIEINLDKISTDISRLMFIMTIDNGDELNQRFEKIKGISAELLDKNNPLLQYSIDDLTKETAVIALEIYKHGTEWKLQATGNGFNSGLAAILKQYGSDAIQVQEETPTPPAIKQNYVPPKSEAEKLSERSAIVNQQIVNSGLGTQKAQVVTAINLSCSMALSLKSGKVQEVLEKVLPMAMKFDDDGQIDVFLFHDEVFNHKTPFTLKNKQNFILNEILFKYHLGEAFYAPVIKKITTKYANAGKGADPAYILFITDGFCDDSPQTEAAIKEASSKGVFWQIIGIGDNKAGIEFLNKLDKMSGRTVDNVNYFHIDDLKKINDQELYKRFLDEFSRWTKEARQQGVI